VREHLLWRELNLKVRIFYPGPILQETILESEETRKKVRQAEAQPTQALNRLHVKDRAISEEDPQSLMSRRDSHRRGGQGGERDRMSARR
jgi:hypothetical protein